MTGSSVVNVNGGSSVILFSTDEFAGMFGRQFNVSRDFFAVMNADGNSAHVHVEGATWDSRYGMYAVFSEKMSGLIRINYVCIIAE